LEKKQMAAKYTAVVQRDGKWWIGWLQEIPGVNGQGRTRAACLASMRSALKEALEMNRAEALAAAQSPFEEVSIDA
jgi:predicted RNase H-like HicB family nuclease